jgi:hypothetical protein
MGELTMRSMVVAALVTMVLLPGAAFAQTTPDAPPVPLQEGTAVVQQDGTVTSGSESTTAERPDPDAEVICRVVQSVETRLARSRQRVCGTRTMWEQMEDQNARDVRRAGTVQGRR